MADAFTDNIRLRQPEVGAHDGSWAELLNEMIQMADLAVAGAVTVDVTSASVVLTANTGTDDQSRRMFIYVTGTQSVSRTIEVQDTAKLYVLVNNSSWPVVFERASGGDTLTLNPGQTCLAFVMPGGVYEMRAAGSSVDDTAVVSELTLDINATPGAGDTQTDMEYIVQGSWAFVNIRAFSSQNFSGTTFSLDNAAGNWPSAIVPPDARRVPVIVIENSTVVPAILIVSSSAASAWVIERVDGDPWLGTGTDDRAISHNISFVYPIRDAA